MCDSDIINRIIALLSVTNLLCVSLAHISNPADPADPADPRYEYIEKKSIYLSLINDANPTLQPDIYYSAFFPIQPFP